ncbi:dockerin type I repeat-containing protein [Patescibacteria group bacterium]|nr:dockerin type I repeat-containing protein [Patescibacteria group bacterium]MBU2459938.1 dockerin type I repeat-containing protein [Patescibacteria group bacterium]
MQNYNSKSKKLLFFSYIILIFSFAFFIFTPALKNIRAASSVGFQIEIIYAKETHQIDTTSSFTETLSNPNESSFDINLPADVLTSGAAVNLTMYSTPEESVTTNKPLPSGKLASDIFYNISFTKVSDGSTVSSFNKAVTLTFYYTDSDISGIDEDTLTAYRWNGSAWTALSDSAVDTSLNKVTATTQQFSDFGIFGDAPAPAPSCGDGSCNGSETCSSCPTDCGSCPSTGGGGGGGGGGGYVAPVTSVVFSGRAYPKSTVTLLKDAQIAATTVAGVDAKFQLNLTGVSAGNYIFSVYSEDSEGRRSSLLTFPVGVTYGATTNISGIFIAPTIAVDKSEVKRGDNIVIFGQSVSDGDITIIVNSEEDIFRKVSADENGVYLYNFDSSLLDMGQHFTKSKAAYIIEVSSFSKTIGFLVGTKNVAKAAQEFLKGDLNGDGRVNLVDFSIAAYWYKRTISAEFAVKESERMNGDGKVDLVDFSIMAFYWTG